MKALPLIPLLVLCALTGAAADARPPEPLVLADLTFETDTIGPDEPIQIRSGRGHSPVSVRRSRLEDVAGLAQDESDGAVRFAIPSEAGRTECTGNRNGEAAEGTCRFVSNPAFEAGLAERGIAFERRGDLITLALVDARMALVDDLSRDGFVIADSADLVAATALRITGAWAHELKRAGLTVKDFSDLIAARALDVDGAFLRAMAKVGYPRLSANQAVAMKAVGVTPAYAEAMNRAALAMRAIDEAGELQ